MSSRSFTGLAPALCAAVLLLPATAFAVPESAQLTPADALKRLQDNAGGLSQLTRQVHPEVAYTLLRAKGAQPLLQDNSLALPLDRALNFLSLNGAVMGVTDPLRELALSRQATDDAGNKTVHLNQMHAGLPVFGARLVVHMNNAGVTGVNGVFVPDLAGLSSTPAMNTATLRGIAMQIAAKQHRGAELALESSRLMYYRSGLLEGRSGTNYLAYEAIVRGPAGEAIRDRIILNANTGALINQINEIHSVLNRAIHTPNISTPALITEGSPLVLSDPPLAGEGPSNPASRVPRNPLENLYIFAGGTYNLYKNFFGREGYNDGAIAPEDQVQHSVYLVNEKCPNAYWDGTSTNYCPAFDADDVVSHEWSHAYSEYTHGLVYQYQSGALNESYSDIFGETYDQVNGIEGPLGITLPEDKYYADGGSRWVVGEDLSEALAAVLLRDMWDPDGFGVALPGVGTILPTPSPGSVITSENYYCGPDQSTLVHTDSGVPNHAYAMLVDGKEFNGVTIPAIGLTKAAHIYFQAETHYQTPTTNFAQHADALEASCHDLIGAELNDATGKVSGEHITQADCDAVAAAMLATEMRSSPVEKCGYTTLLKPEADTPAVCAAGETEAVDFSENWDKSTDFPSGWNVTNNFTGGHPVHYPWIVTAAQAPHEGNAAFVKNPSSGGGQAADQDQSGSTLLESPEIAIASNASFFKFTHAIATEPDFDGGNLKASINGGEFAIVPASAMTFNAYNDDALLAAPDNTNPIAGEPAFTGSDAGESFSQWGTTIVDLAAIGVKSGDKVKFRFDYGQDVATGNVGWYIDDVSVVHCSAKAAPAKSAPISRFGGAFGLGLLLPLLGFAALRKRRAV